MHAQPGQPRQSGRPDTTPPAGAGTGPGRQPPAGNGRGPAPIELVVDNQNGAGAGAPTPGAGGGQRSDAVADRENAGRSGQTASDDLVNAVEQTFLDATMEGHLKRMPTSFAKVVIEEAVTELSKIRTGGELPTNQPRPGQRLRWPDPPKTLSSDQGPAVDPETGFPTNISKTDPNYMSFFTFSEKMRHGWFQTLGNIVNVSVFWGSRPLVWLSDLVSDTIYYTNGRNGHYRKALVCMAKPLERAIGRVQKVFTSHSGSAAGRIPGIDQNAHDLIRDMVAKVKSEASSAVSDCVDPEIDGSTDQSVVREIQHGVVCAIHRTHGYAEVLERMVRRLAAGPTDADTQRVEARIAKEKADAQAAKEREEAKARQLSPDVAALVGQMQQLVDAMNRNGVGQVQSRDQGPVVDLEPADGRRGTTDGRLKLDDDEEVVTLKSLVDVPTRPLTPSAALSDYRENEQLYREVYSKLSSKGKEYLHELGGEPGQKPFPGGRPEERQCILFNEDSRGNSIIKNLHTLAVYLDDDPAGAEMLETVVARFHHPGRSVQDLHGSCGASALLTEMSLNNMAEYSRIVTEVLVKKSARLPGGMPVVPPRDVDDLDISSDRPKFDKIFQAMYMRYAIPSDRDGWSYRNSDDKFVNVDGEERDAGFSNEDLLLMLQQNHGPGSSFTAVTRESPFEYRTRVEEELRIGGRNFLTTMEWGPDEGRGRVAGHAVVVTGYTDEDGGRFTFINPHGPQARQTGANLSDPDRRLDNAETGEESMSAAVFWEHVNSVFVPRNILPEIELIPFDPDAPVLGGDPESVDLTTLSSDYGDGDFPGMSDDLWDLTDIPADLRPDEPAGQGSSSLVSLKQNEAPAVTGRGEEPTIAPITEDRLSEARPAEGSADLVRPAEDEEEQAKRGKQDTPVHASEIARLLYGGRGFGSWVYRGLKVFKGHSNGNGSVPIEEGHRLFGQVPVDPYVVDRFQRTGTIGGTQMTFYAGMQHAATEGSPAEHKEACNFDQIKSQLVPLMSKFETIVTREAPHIFDVSNFRNPENRPVVILRGSDHPTDPNKSLLYINIDQVNRADNQGSDKLGRVSYLIELNGSNSADDIFLEIEGKNARAKFEELVAGIDPTGGFGKFLGVSDAVSFDYSYIDKDKLK